MPQQSRGNLWERSGPGQRLALMGACALAFSLLVGLISANVRCSSGTYFIPAPAMTPIGMMALRGATLDQIDAYITERPESLEEISLLGKTALMEAAGDGRHDLMRLLLERGADPNFEARMTIGAVKSESGEERPLTMALTALQHAAMADDAEAMRILLAAGADPEQVTRLGEPLASVARRLDVPELLESRGDP